MLNGGDGEECGAEVEGFPQESRIFYGGLDGRKPQELKTS